MINTTNLSAGPGEAQIASMHKVVIIGAGFGGLADVDRSPVPVRPDARDDPMRGSKRSCV